MAFLRRILDHLFNQVLVETLANSKSFQRFAVWSNEMFKELKQQGQQHSKVLDEQLSKASQTLKQRGDQFRKEFEEEMRKAQQAQQQQQAKKK